ncbi:MAG: nicotinic acid mononucleotide adenylyltransferase [Gammaproteobacteria bacterium]|nr:MAG: nicotinic acid mononucleotide adenylyltransferase [Gammaproteobacteria bacterium]
MIGIYGGTFDPIHYGHLRTAFEIREKLALEALRFVPCKKPVHRGEPSVSAKKRLELLQLAVADAPELTIDTCELERSGESFMVDTLRHIKEEVKPGKPLVLIVGMDAFLGLSGWSRWIELFELAHVAVMMRPGWQCDVPGELAEQIKERVAGEFGELSFSEAGKVCFLEVTQLEISATEIRRMLQLGSDPRYLLPDEVREMIIKENLYR